MAFSFTVRIPLGTDLEGKLEQAKFAASNSDHDVLISGNISSGIISGDVTGSYRVSGNTINVTITDKPWLATEGLIKKTVRDFFS